jgi:Spy/CpxP family protein refolding chaperone
MKKWLQLGLLIAVAALLGAGACFLTGWKVKGHDHADPVEDHHWVHQQLHLSPEQDAKLEPIERKFEEKRPRLTSLIQEGNRKLAEAISQDKADSPKVREAIAEIHNAQGELQNAVLEHVFDMKAVLSPEQYEHLVQLTVEALKHANESR